MSLKTNENSTSFNFYFVAVSNLYLMTTNTCCLIHFYFKFNTFTSYNTSQTKPAKCTPQGNSVKFYMPLKKMNACPLDLH